MGIKILTFGIARDVVGAVSVEMDVPSNTTAGKLKEILFQRYPAFHGLSSLAIAVNGEYAQEDYLINPSDEIVLIPPVSGG